MSLIQISSEDVQYEPQSQNIACQQHQEEK